MTASDSFPAGTLVRSTWKLCFYQYVANSFPKRSTQKNAVFGFENKHTDDRLTSTHANVQTLHKTCHIQTMWCCLTRLNQKPDNKTICFWAQLCHVRNCDQFTHFIFIGCGAVVRLSFRDVLLLYINYLLNQIYNVWVVWLIHWWDHKHRLTTNMNVFQPMH